MALQERAKGEAEGNNRANFPAQRRPLVGHQREKITSLVMGGKAEKQKTKKKLHAQGEIEAKWACKGGVTTSIFTSWKVQAHSDGGALLLPLLQLAQKVLAMVGSPSSRGS